jgi:hypothetical protein
VNSEPEFHSTTVNDPDEIINTQLDSDGLRNWEWGLIIVAIAIGAIIFLACIILLVSCLVVNKRRDSDEKSSEIDSLPAPSDEEDPKSEDSSSSTNSSRYINRSSCYPIILYRTSKSNKSLGKASKNSKIESLEEIQLEENTDNSYTESEEYDNKFNHKVLIPFEVPVKLEARLNLLHPVAQIWE